MCATKISERRRIELRQGVETWLDRGGATALVTYTVRHKRADDLRSTLEGLLKARKGLLSGRWASGFTQEFGVVGRVRALEVTHGENGWHPHVHELVFLNAGGSTASMVQQLRARWASQVVAVGLREVNSHGVDLRLSDWSVAEYVAKFGYERAWDVDHEVTKAVSKEGKPGNRGPVGLLRDCLGGDETAGTLWRQYALTFKGRRQLAWSDGLRKLLSLGEELTDQELVEQQTAHSVLMDELEREEWKHVLGNDARAELLDVLSRGSVAELREFLHVIGIMR